jgi:hypothetical protein
VKKMSKNLNLDLETRLNIVKTADEVIKDCRDCWNQKEPITRESIPVINEILKTLVDDLYKIKKLPVVVDESLKRKRELYIDSLLAIPKRQMEELSRFAKNNWYYKAFYPKRDEDMPTKLLLVDLKSAIAGLDDICTGVIKAEEVRNSDLTLEGLNKDAIGKAKQLYQHVSERKGELNKDARSMAETVWSVYYAMHPITEIDDENMLYQMIAVGNFASWKNCHQKKLVEINYVNKVRNEWYNRWKDPELRKKMVENRLSWTNDVCFPELLYISALPELHIALLETEKSEKKHLDYIS